MNEAAPPVVTLRGLTRRFGDFVAVNGVDLNVAKGEIFGFLGPNGAGKSTTIRMLCGILAPTSGTGIVAGIDIAREPERVKAHIGYMSQKFSLYEDLTVAENIAFYAGIYRIPRGRRRERTEWVVRMAGLSGYEDERTGILPQGLKQRLSLGCAVIHEPPVIFLDEPTSGVDPLSRRAFWDLIHELSGREVTVFVTTHYMEEAEYCDRLGLIDRGELVALGAPRELKTTLMRGEILEVACERPADALTAATAVSGVREAALFGNALHVTCEDAQDLAPRLAAALDAAGFGPATARPIPPTLEDVFVSLTENRDRQEAKREFSA